jgi:PPOX class probable F420-dependent enzyme
MPSRRKEIAMTDAEIADFVAGQKRLHMATNGPGGFPHVVPMNFAYIDGMVHMLSYGASQKTLNLRRDPRMAVMLEAGNAYQELRGVTIQGEAELVEGDIELANRVSAGIAAKENPATAPRREPGVMEQRRTKRAVIRLRPQRVFSWDHRKLQGRY